MKTYEKNIKNDTNFVDSPRLDFLLYPMARIRLVDVAQRAGVSVATVSRIVNDPLQVHLDTREQVYKAMEELGYQVPLRDKPRRKGKGAIALVTSHRNSEFFSEFLSALQESFFTRNLYPLLVDTRGDFSLSSFLKTDTSWASLVDGVIVFYCDIDEQARDFLRERNLPVAVVHNRCPYYFSVMNNDYLGGFDAAAHLWERGYRNIGVVTWSLTEEGKIRDRLTGFLTYLKEQGQEMDQSRMWVDSMTIDGGYRATEKALQVGGIDALFFTTDTMAVGGMEYCREQGISIPRDLGVLGFDDLRIAQAMNLTTMKQFIPGKAKAIADHLFERFDNPFTTENTEELTFTPVLIHRKTT